MTFILKSNIIGCNKNKIWKRGLRKLTNKYLSPKSPPKTLREGHLRVRNIRLIFSKRSLMSFYAEKNQFIKELTARQP